MVSSVHEQSSLPALRVNSSGLKAVSISSPRQTKKPTPLRACMPNLRTSLKRLARRSRCFRRAS